MPPKVKKPFYITTTLPYVNSDPHIGFAMEIIRADIIARYMKEKGYDVFLNTGTDEHGIKIYRNATEKGIAVQEYVDNYASKFKNLIPLLGILPETHFIRTTDQYHVKSAQKFWEKCLEGKDYKGQPYIYKKNYKIKYCIGCELEKTESELKDGRCELHPNKEIELIDEENYFFRFSSFSGRGHKDSLLDFYEKNPSFVIPDFRFNEIKAFVERGLEDFSISRMASKMPWGIPVPGDEGHVMYVWFDALVNYISAVGWPHDMDSFEKWINETGGMVQYCGKDNLRQQSAIWQAMLMSIGLPNSKNIIINGFVTGEGGIKMSKSLGNTIDPLDLINEYGEYGQEALRHFVAKEIRPFEDSPFTMDKFKETYNSNLANGIGNLLSRVMKMSTGNSLAFENGELEGLIESLEKTSEIKEAYDKYHLAFSSFDLEKASSVPFDLVSSADIFIQKEQPFKKIKTDRQGGEKDIKDLMARLYIIGKLFSPILPNTSKIIIECVSANKMPDRPLFLRK